MNKINNKNVARRDTLRKNTDYVAYIQRLKANGYFKNEVEGSSTWNDLENRAANVYVNTTRDEYLSLFIVGLLTHS